MHTRDKVRISVEDFRLVCIQQRCGRQGDGAGGAPEEAAGHGEGRGRRMGGADGRRRLKKWLTMGIRKQKFLKKAAQGDNMDAGPA